MSVRSERIRAAADARARREEEERPTAVYGLPSEPDGQIRVIRPDKVALYVPWDGDVERAPVPTLVIAEANGYLRVVVAPGREAERIAEVNRWAAEDWAESLRVDVVPVQMLGGSRG